MYPIEKKICPICDTPCEYDAAYLGDLPIDEQSYCPNDHYYFESSTGHMEVKIGEVTVYMDSMDDEEDIEHKTAIIKQCILYERQKWQKQEVNRLDNGGENYNGS